MEDYDKFFSNRLRSRKKLSDSELSRRFNRFLVPEWAQTELTSFWNYDECCFNQHDSTLTTSLLANYLNKHGIGSFNELSGELLTGFRSEVLPFYKRQHEKLLSLFKFVAFLASQRVVSLDLIEFTEFVVTKDKFTLRLRNLYPDKIIAKDLIEQHVASRIYLPPPDWSMKSVAGYAQICPDFHQAVTMVRWLDRHFVILGWTDVKPSHFAALIEARYCASEDTIAYNKFIDYLISQKIISPVFANIYASWRSYRFLETEGLDLACSLDGATPEELLAVADAVTKTMSDLGYSKSRISSGLVGIKKFSLFLKEHSLTFSAKLALAWADRQFLADYAGKLDMRVGLFVAHKLLSETEITPDIIFHEFHCPRKGHSKRKIPKWAEDSIKLYINQRKADGISKSTIRGFISAIKCFTDFLTSRSCTDFSKLRVDLLNNFNRQDYHEKSSGKSTYNSRIRGFLLFLADRGVISYSLVLALPHSRAASEKPVIILTDEQIRAVHKFCTNANTERLSRDALALKLALLLGLRASDIVDLRFDDIDLTRKMLVFTQNKTGKITSIPIPDTVLEDLSRYLKAGRKEVQNNHVMVATIAPHHHLISPSSIRQTASVLGCEHFTLHELRKTYATHLVKCGTGVELTARLVGHSDLSTVHRYLALDADMLRPLCLPLEGLEIDEDLLP